MQSSDHENHSEPNKNVQQSKTKQRNNDNLNLIKLIADELGDSLKSIQTTLEKLIDVKLEAVTKHVPENTKPTTYASTVGNSNSQVSSNLRINQEQGANRTSRAEATW